MWPDISILIKDGYDLQWGTNVIGHFLFTKLLVPYLQEGAKSSPDNHARVVFTSLGVAYLDTIHWDTFKPGPARDKFGTYGLYNQSKHVSLKSIHSIVDANDLHLCAQRNVVVANEFARRYIKDRIVTSFCKPGNFRSELHRHLNAVTRYISVCPPSVRSFPYVSGSHVQAYEIIRSAALASPRLHPVQYGALTQLWAGTSPEKLEMNGKVRPLFPIT